MILTTAMSGLLCSFPVQVLQCGIHSIDTARRRARTAAQLQHRHHATGAHQLVRHQEAARQGVPAQPAQRAARAHHAGHDGQGPGSGVQAQSPNAGGTTALLQPGWRQVGAAVPHRPQSADSDGKATVAAKNNVSVTS